MKIQNLAVILFLAGALFSCQGKRSTENLSDEELKKLSVELAHRFVIIDGHVDLPTVLHEKKFRADRDRDTLLKAGKGDFDYERAVRGGLSAPFMSIYVPASYQNTPDNGKAFADSLIGYVRGMASVLPDKFALAGSTKEVDANFAAGKISLPMGMENGAPIGIDLANVKYFYDQGIRYVTLTHTRDNQFCDSSGDSTHTWNGLSPLGNELIKEMNRVGMMVDISHVDDSTFYQVMAMTKVPCIASHSSCRYFSPNAPRDMTDDMIRKLGENKGVILINFYGVFLDSSVYHRMKEDKKMLDILLEVKKIKSDDPRAEAVAEQFRKSNPLPKIDVSVVANHIDHVVKIAGIDYVGLGSDFDGGVDESLPQGLTDVSMYPNLIYVLLKRGYSESDIEKICGGNFRRVWNEVEAAAQH